MLLAVYIQAKVDSKLKITEIVHLCT